MMAALIIGDDANSQGCASRLLYAIVAQLVEQLTFNQQAAGFEFRRSHQYLSVYRRTDLRRR